MARFIKVIDNNQTVIFPDWLEDWIGENAIVLVVDLFVDALHLPTLGFRHLVAARTVRPGCHPAVVLSYTFMAIWARFPLADGWRARRGGMLT